MNVCIIGGGAAGMMAAITAADCGHRVTLLERQARVGRKLMATGSGRCNLTNRHAAPEHYHGEDRDFCAYALSAFDVDATLDWFAAHGLVTEEILVRDIAVRMKLVLHSVLLMILNQKQIRL